jgi:hypothetical protein
MKTTKTMKTMKTTKTMKMIKLLAYVFIGGLFAACSSDSVDDTPTPVVPTTYSGEITEDVTWTSSNIYTLDGRVMVVDGVTLTIEAGTVIKGAAGTGADASCLVIARGGKIMANGNAANPIVFTSVADNSTDGISGFGSGLSSSDQGLWGGVLILGNADISAESNPLQIEGIPIAEANGLYGGGNSSNNNDNSGILHYVQIRHGGAEIGEGNEINGLTLGGVGSGTSIHHVEIIANLDDGLECFGGSVDCSNILVWGQGDDAFDVDQSYSGTIDNFLGIMISGDQGLEIDGWEGTMQADFSLMNGTIIGAPGDKNNCGKFKSNASGSVSNMLFTNMKDGATLTVDAGATGITFSNISFDANYSQTLIDDLGGANFDDNNNGTGGATLSNFDGWTCASYMNAY